MYVTWSYICSHQLCVMWQAVKHNVWSLITMQTIHHSSTSDASSKADPGGGLYISKFTVFFFTKMKRCIAHGMCPFFSERLYFNNISAILWQSFLLVEKPKVLTENHQPSASHWQILSHNVASSTSRLTYYHCELTTCTSGLK